MDKSRISGAPRAEGVIPEEHSVTRREERSNMPSVQEQEGEGGTRGGDKDASFPVLGAASQESFTAPVSRSIRAFVFHPSFPWPDEIILEQGCGGERCRGTIRDATLRLIVAGLPENCSHWAKGRWRQGRCTAPHHGAACSSAPLQHVISLLRNLPRARLIHVGDLCRLCGSLSPPSPAQAPCSSRQLPPVLRVVSMGSANMRSREM
nr:uncharacterized protein LOC110366324 isoform X3 [Columba livia]